MCTFVSIFCIVRMFDFKPSYYSHLKEYISSQCFTETKPQHKNRQENQKRHASLTTFRSRNKAEKLLLLKSFELLILSLLCNYLSHSLTMRKENLKSIEYTQGRKQHVQLSSKFTCMFLTCYIVFHSFVLSELKGLIIIGLI